MSVFRDLLVTDTARRTSLSVLTWKFDLLEGQMKTILLTTAAALASLLTISAASAADLAPMPVEPMAPVVVPFTWTGFYVGAHIGGVWGDEDDDLSDNFPGSGTGGGGGGGGCPQTCADSFSMSGVIGGVHAGYNWQIDQWVLGVEGDFDGTSLEGSHDFSGAPFDPVTGIDTFSGRLKMKSNCRLRCAPAPASPGIAS